jgi:hypothetical protein
VKTRYDNGTSQWEHGEPCDYESGIPTHRLLGPCPRCGTQTFNYGGGWRCRSWDCFCSANNVLPNIGPRPEWWNTGINVIKDDNQWCATGPGFINLQESHAGFGNTPEDAVNDLGKVQP